MSAATLALDARDEAMLAGADGPGTQLAMRVLVAMARAAGAPRLVDITGAHIDGCLYHGPASLDLARRLLDGGARVRVPTTLNVGGIDRTHPDRWHGDPADARAAADLMALYEELGGRPTFTCAPYQLAQRPGRGERVAWAESNAIVFANSVLGARTNRNGDFLDIAAAVTGRAPEYGLLTDEGRRGGVVVDVTVLPEPLRHSEVLGPVLGHLVGRLAGDRVPVIVGLPEDTGEDVLKALGAAAAASGSVAMFHAVGVTPEAPDVLTATGGRDVETVAVTARMLVTARDDLTTAVAGDRLGAVSIGTPHFSLDEFRAVAALLASDPLPWRPAVPLYVSTSRAVLDAARDAGLLDRLDAPGVRFVVDTCTYVAPVMDPVDGPVMTNSAKWALYAPANVGVDVVFGSLAECLRSVREGRVWRDDRLWEDPRGTAARGR